MKLPIHLSFALLSLLLYSTAPDSYNYNYCLIISLLFIIQNFIYFSLKKTRLVGFQFLFMIAFFFTNFVYPLFYFRTNQYVSVFSLSFNYNIITKATALAYVAYAFYILGISIIETQKKNNKSFRNFQPYKFSVSNYSRLMKYIFSLSIISLVSFIITGGHKAIANQYGGDQYMDVNGISSYIFVFFSITSVLLSIFVFKLKSNTKKKYYLSIILFFILFFLATGSRTIPLALGLCLLISYDRYKNISKLSFLIIIVLGVLTLTFVMFARSVSFGDDDYLKNGLMVMKIEKIWDLGMDLIINNRNLYLLYDYANNIGYTYGLTMLGGLASPIPFLQGFICDTFNIQPDFINSAKFGTFLELGFGSSWGIGSNVVGDVYLSFGLLGTISLFLLFGLFVSYTENNSYKNIYWEAIWCILVSNSIYLVRTGLFDHMRTYLWAILILFLLNNKINHEVKNIINNP